MLRVLTGTPGAGKTCRTLQAVYEMMQENSKAIEKDPTVQKRQIYFHNVTDVDLDFFDALPMPDPQLWYELPIGSILVFDEAQEVFPQRSASKEVPEHVKRIAKFRHLGMDLFITTQDANNIDVFIRRLINQYIFIQRIGSTKSATIFEYAHYEPNPTGYHERKSALSIRVWRYPKKFFDKYTSAAQHNFKSKIPFKVYLVIFFFLSAAGLIWMVYDRLVNDRFGDDVVAQESNSTGQSYINNSVPGRTKSIVTAQDYLDQWKPRVIGIMSSAPMYDAAFKVEVVPRPVCAIVQDFGTVDAPLPENSQCSCYTQQNTRYPTPDEYCRSWALDGYFDPTRDFGDGGGRSAGSPQTPPPGM